MMGPYRTPPEPHDDEKTVEDSRRRDDLILAGLLLLLGGVRLTMALVTGEVFRTEATLSLFMVAFGGVVILRRS